MWPAEGKMSTRDIRRVLNWMQHNRPAGTAQVVAAALAEVEAIEKAARVWSSEDLPPENEWDAADRTMRRISEGASK